MLARLVDRLLRAVPGPLVDGIRRRQRLARIVHRLFLLVSRPLHGRTVVIENGRAQGLAFRITPVSGAWSTGNVETPVQEALSRLLKPGDVFFDIGANVGFFTIIAARAVGPSGIVVAFEPHPDNLEVLRTNVELNRFSNLVVVGKAVSDAAGHRLLDASGSATARLVSQENGAPDRRSISVEGTTVDDFVAQNDRLSPAVVKIDAEGHELDVVRGMTRTLRECRPLLVCEMHGSNREFAALLAELGYRGTVLGDNRPLEEASPSAHVLAGPEGHPLVLDFTSGAGELGRDEHELQTSVPAREQPL